MSDATIEFRLDDAYLEEYHGEWVASVGRGWRIGRRLTIALLVVGSMLLGASAMARTPMLPLAGFAACALAAVNVGVRRREKARWVAIARKKLPVGNTLRLLVEDGGVRRDDPSAQKVPAASADLLDTPRGYLFRLTVPATPESDAKPLAGSLYVPHRAVQPSMDRAAFRALFR